MADAKKRSSQWPGDAMGSAEAQSDELESLREEVRRLRQLVVQLSRIAIRNAANMK